MRSVKGLRGDLFSNPAQKRTSAVRLWRVATVACRDCVVSSREYEGQERKGQGRDEKPTVPSPHHSRERIEVQHRCSAGAMSTPYRRDDGLWVVKLGSSTRGGRGASLPEEATTSIHHVCVQKQWGHVQVSTTSTVQARQVARRKKRVTVFSTHPQPSTCPEIK